jgi:hypothetical protein
MAVLLAWYYSTESENSPLLKSRAATEVPYSTRNSLTFETSEVLKCV